MAVPQGNAARTRSTRRRLTRLSAAAVAVLLTVTACTSSKSTTAGGSADSGGAAVPAALTFGTPSLPPTMNPATGDPAYGMVYQWAYDPLLVMNGDGTYRAGLAVKWGYVGEGNQTYELTLREGVKFSDGTALDAAAVKTYLDYERAQTTGSMAGLLVNVASIDVTGPLTVRLNLSKADPGMTFYFAQAFGAGNIASPTAVANPASLDTTTAGAGPYMLDPAQSVTGDHYVYVQNPNYWDKSRQHWTTVTIRSITNPSSMVQAMQAGQVQLALGDATTLQAAASAGLDVTAPPQALTGLNLADRDGQLVPALGDVRVRQALNMAVDRKTLAKALYGDENLALSQYALEGQPGYDPKLDDAYPLDVDKAKQLLADAGYPDGFTIPVLSTPIFSFDKLMQAIGGQLQAIGVTLEVTSKATPADYFTSMLSGENPTAAIGYGLANMNTLYAGFVNPQGPFNWFHIVDPELDALYQQYNVADEAAGAALEKQINARLVDQAWTIPIVGAPLSYYTAKGITGMDATSANAGVPWVTDLRPAS